jgi:hypothetical protein
MKIRFAITVCLGALASAPLAYAQSAGLPSRETTLLIGTCIDATFGSFDQSNALVGYGYRQTKNRADRRQFKKAFKAPPGALLKGGYRAANFEIRRIKRKNLIECGAEIFTDESPDLILNFARQEMAARGFQSVGNGLMRNGQAQFKTSVFMSGSSNARRISINISRNY